MRNSKKKLVLLTGVILTVMIGLSAQPVSADTFIIQQPRASWYSRTSGYGIGHWYYADQVTGNTYAGVNTWGYAYSEAYVAMRFWLPPGTYDILYSATYIIKYLKMDCFWAVTACNAQFRLGLTDTNWNYINGEFFVALGFHCDGYNPHYEGYMTEPVISQWYLNGVEGGRYIYLTAGVWTDASLGARVCGDGNDPRMAAQVLELCVQIQTA